MNHRFSLGAVQPRLKDTRLIRTLHYYEQFALYLGKEEPLLFSKLNPINKGTPVTFYDPPSVSVLTGLTVLWRQYNKMKQNERTGWKLKEPSLDSNTDPY